MGHSRNSIRARELIVLGAMLLIFFFWIFPITALASLLSYEEIKRTMPWLGRWIDANDQLRAIVQNVLPSVAMIALNALLPFLFEGISNPLIPWPDDVSDASFPPSFDLPAGIPCTKLGRVFPDEEILPLPTRQRRFHLFAREYLLAADTGARGIPRQST